MPSQESKWSQTGLALGGKMSQQRKITDPVRSLDIRISWAYTTAGGAVMTLTNLANRIGMLSLISYIKIKGSDSYVEVFSVEEILALLLKNPGSAYIEIINNAAVETAYVDEVCFKIPIGLKRAQETVTVDVQLATAATVYSANEPAASAIEVDVAVGMGPVENQYRTHKYAAAASAENVFDTLPTTGILTDIFILKDIDNAAPQTFKDFIQSVDEVLLTQNKNKVTSPTGHQCILNFLELQKNIEATICEPLLGIAVGHIPVNDLVLTNTEEIKLIQDAAFLDTYDLVLVVVDGQKNVEVEAQAYLSSPTNQQEVSPMSPDLVAVKPTNEGLVPIAFGGSLNIGGSIGTFQPQPGLIAGQPLGHNAAKIQLGRQ